MDTSEAVCEDVVGKVVVEAESEGCEGTKVLMAKGDEAEFGRRIGRGHTSLGDRFGGVDMEIMGDVGWAGTS